jgi:glycosyltransferase involved in cell wall biosynthesis
MKIGLYVGNASPTIGGAYTLLETVKRDIVLSHCKYEIFIFFNDISSKRKRFTEDGITYINLSHGKANFFQKAIRKIFSKYFKLKDVLVFDNVLHKENVDLLWILGPYNIDITIPYIFTVWDLGHRMLPCFSEVSIGQNGKLWNEREELCQRMLYRATYIVTGNETGKKEILANYAVNPEKIHIIPFPIPSFCYSPKVTNTAIIPNIKFPFVFYPAQFWAHKNHIVLIEAIAWLRDIMNIHINCYLVGSDQGNLSYIIKIINKYCLHDQIIVLGFVEQSTLIYLYKNALAMIYLSFMGPNNLPPFEAAALGCPLIISNIPGHIEQMEDTGLLVDATNPIEVGRAILSIYNNPTFRDQLISAAQVFIQKYKTYSYFQEMQKLIDFYAVYCKTWKEVESDSEGG